MLIKNREERRETVTLDTKIMLLRIVEQIANTTEANWLKDEIKDPIKDSLCDFVGYVRANKIVGWLGELDEFGFIQEFCEGKHDLDIKSLKEFLNAIKNSLFH